MISLPMRQVLPGILLACALAAVVGTATLWLGFALTGAIVPAMVLGMASRLFWHRVDRFQAGLALTARLGLQVAIVLLGLRISFAQVGIMGWSGAATMIILVGATLAFTLILGRFLGVDKGLSGLLAAGTSICGASAVLAANTVVQARNEDAVYSVACVSLLGTMSVLILPSLGQALGLPVTDIGLWIGGTVHEIGQVAAAAAQLGPEGLDMATLSKLERVALLAPVVTVWAMVAKGTPLNEMRLRHFLAVPWFLIGFVLAMALTSFVPLPKPVLDGATLTATALMLVALGAMGLRSDPRQILACGLRPLLLAVAAWIFITLLGLLLVVVL